MIALTPGTLTDTLIARLRRQWMDGHMPGAKGAEKARAAAEKEKAAYGWRTAAEWEKAEAQERADCRIKLKA